jgi:putative ABC transport system permease protein
VIPDLHLGPVSRALARHTTAFVLMVLELASGFLVMGSLLLTGAWYWRTATTPTGYDESDLVTVMVHRPAPADGAAIPWQRAAEAQAIAAVAGVMAVAPVSTLLSSETWSRPALIAVPGESRVALAWSISTSPALAQVLGLRFLEGDLPRPRPGLEQIVIARAVRDRLFAPGTPAIGRMLLVDDRPAVVAAVVGDVLLRERFGRSSFALVLRFGSTADERQARYLVRTRPGARPAVMAALPGVLGGAGPDRVVAVEAADAARTDRRVFARTIIGLLVMTGATIAVTALLGVLAVSSFLVSQRARQLAVRRALGAGSGDIIRHILVETWLSTALGTALGLAATLALCTLMRRAFPGLVADGRLLALTALVLWIDCTAAALVPALRAARIPPSVASRAG